MGKDRKRFLAKIKPLVDEQNGYILHPLISDAMLQLMAFPIVEQEPTTLFVPVKITKFLRISEVTKDDELYVFLMKEDSTSSASKSKALLINSEGLVRAAVSSVEVVRTSPKALESVLEQQTNAMPGLWEQVWKPKAVVIDPESHPVSSTTWLVFHSRESPLSNHLLEKLKDGGNEVISVEVGENFEENKEQTKFILRKNLESDYKLLWQRLTSKNLKGIIYCWSLTDDIQSQEDVLRPLFLMSKSLLQSESFGEFPKLLVVTKGAPTGGFHSTPIFSFVKSLKHQALQLDSRCINVENEERVLEEVLSEIWNTQVEPEIIVSFDENGNRQVPRLEEHFPLNRSLRVPLSSERYQLLIPVTKTIADLSFVPIPERELGPTQIEVEVRAAGLNFREVFSILKPSPEFAACNSVGLDFAGVVRRVGSSVKTWAEGDPVFGSNLDVYSAPFPSRQIVDEKVVLGVPADMTFCEAATLPTAFLTVFHSLIEVAKIKPTDVLLIHAASGAVGLCALQLAKWVGCTVIATAGNERKRGYLRSQGIQESHIFSSRSTDYEAEIKKLTNGRGVDVVLNSLTSSGFKEATLGCCAPRARFVEMSKMSIWTPEQVAALRPDVAYTIVDISQLDQFPEKQGKIFGELELLLKKKVVIPLPFTRFDGVNIRDALGYLQHANDIGKVVCVMPESQNGKVSTLLFNDRSSYLITGGLGGIGFVVFQWMIENGAKYVILAGRRLPSAETEASIREMNSKGATIKTVQLDISNSEQVGKFFKKWFETKGLPPLRGIMHAAGTLADSLIVNQDWTSFSQPFGAKVEGTLNLHKFSRGLNLEHFVLFSSATSLLGPKGQANYAAANGFEDAFAHYRHSLGLPATTINWGPWSQVGVAMDVDFPGLKHISNQQGLKALDYALRSNETQLAVWSLESVSSFRKAFPGLGNYLALDAKPAENVESGGNQTQADFWDKFNSAQIEAEKLSLVEETVHAILRGILVLPDAELIEDKLTFQEMGLDSLMFVELSNGLRSIFGGKTRFSSNWLKENNKLAPLSKSILDSLGQSETVDDADEQKRVNALIRKDSSLPPHITPKSGQTIGKVEDIKSVIVLGATGALGPYLLQSLTQLPQVEEVICLIRNGGVERLKKVLAELDLLSKVELGKIRCVTGDISLPHLGMKPEVWNELGGSVDAIFNSAAAIDHLEIYKERGSSIFRAVNIEGTKHVLEFAVEGKLKHIFHASTLFVTTSVDPEDGSLAEAWPNVEDFDNVTTLAYNISKFVGELLIKEAVERGIPCKSFRFPFITGHSETGRMNVQKNHLMQRYIFSLKSGILPSYPVPMPMLPVDICADISMRIFFKENASGVFNITHPQVDLDQEFVKVAEKFGVKVNLVEEAEFSNALQNLAPATSNFALFKDFYTNDSFLHKFSKTAPIFKKWRKGNERYFVSKKVNQLLPNAFQKGVTTMDFVYKDLQFAKEHGSLH